MKYKDRSWLYQKYIEEGLTIYQIGPICAVHANTILRWLVRFGIPTNLKLLAGHNHSDETKHKMSEAHLAEKNPMWKGNDVGSAAGSRRARTWHLLQPCRICRKTAERHHKDSNTLNNEANNIDFLCRKHHMEQDGRLQSKNKKGQFQAVIRG